MSLVTSQPSHAATPDADLYLEIDRAVAQPSDGVTIDVIVGNRGGTAHRDNFDAFLEVSLKELQVCRAATNFVTPIGPGQSIHALRFELHPAGTGNVERYKVRASIRYWDRTRSGPQKETAFGLPPGRGRCIALKPVQ